MMNPKFDERYEIRLAHMSDVDSIMHFIGKFWRKGHVISVNRDFFLYEYANGDNINFVLAIDKTTRKIEALLGHYYCSNPDNLDNIDKLDIWGSMWKVNDSTPNTPLLGVELVHRSIALTNCRMQIGSGANPKTAVPLRKFYFKDKVVCMNQFYYLNPSMSEFKIAVINKQYNISQIVIKESFLIQLPTIDAVRKVFNVDSINSLPYKDSWYLEKRYFKHPYYNYDVYGIHDSYGIISALLVIRILKVNGRYVLRIVDYFGEHSSFRGLQKAFNNLLQEKNGEYIDFVVYGFNESFILDAGFHLRNNTDLNIIPHYFEPFVQENVDIWAHYKFEGTVFFKADGDQDRPNIIN